MNLMKIEKIVLQSPAPLYDEEKDKTRLYYIVCGCALFFGIVIGALSGSFAFLILEILVLLVGWGIRNKKLKYKCLNLRNMRFLVDKKPSYTELYQRLAPVFRVEMNKDGTICIPYDGLCYDIIFNEDDSFSLQWRQPFLKAFIRQEYYISIYKKTLIAMGLIAYHVQRICLNDNELHYEQESINNNTVTPKSVINDMTQHVVSYMEGAKRELSTKGRIALGIGIVIVLLILTGILSMIVGAVVDTAREIFFGIGSGDNVISMADKGGYSNEEMLDIYRTYRSEYIQSDGNIGISIICNDSSDLRELMRYNDDCAGVAVNVDGLVYSNNEGIVSLVLEDYGTVEIDISMCSTEAQEMIFQQDEVRVPCVYTGKIETENGYIPGLVAIDIYQYEPFKWWY